MRSIKLEPDILQDSKNEKSERKTTKSERMIEIIKLRHIEYTLEIGMRQGRIGHTWSLRR